MQICWILQHLEGIEMKSENYEIEKVNDEEVTYKGPTHKWCKSAGYCTN
ncbi:MAG: hypothetical protein GOV02_01655 [Candidatus Aenigmarchaeota archaeon]|nr:hypothetical protein [Candidatus Aenigmarchaeota archaeon]